jgi:succinate-acetate transporter protein
MSSTDSLSPVRVMLRPIGSAVPLGFSGLAVASLVLAGLQLSWMPVTQGTIVGAIIFATAVPLQAVAAINAFAARDGATGTSMGVQSATWAGTAIVLMLSAPGTTSDAFGLMLLAAGGLLLLSALGSGMGKVVVGLVVATVGARFVVSGIYELTASTGVERAAGIVGLVVTGLAAYTALALEMQDAKGRPVLPMLRRARGREAVEGVLREQVDAVATEPGVRQEL